MLRARRAESSFAPWPEGDDVLVEELDEEQEERSGHLDPRGPVHERRAAARPERARDAGPELVREERRAGDERDEPDDDVAAGAEPFERVETLAAPDRLPGAVVADEIEEHAAGGDDHAALEAAAGRDEAERDEPEADEDRRGDGKRPDDADQVIAGVVVGRFAFVAATLAQEQHDAGDRGEEDELLAHRVEAAVVEDDGRDDVRHVPLGQHHLVEQVAVRPDVVPEVGQPGERPDDERGEAGERRSEQCDAKTAVHFFRDRTRAIATSTMRGYATDVTTSAESATSG